MKVVRRHVYERLIVFRTIIVPSWQVGIHFHLYGTAIGIQYIIVLCLH